MSDLIKVTNETISNEVVQAVSARELYLGLGLDSSNWSRWYKENIERNEYFLENKDWIGFVIMTNGNETKDFALTLRFAQHIAMMARTEKSHEYREYLLECEKKLTQPKPRLPQTTAIEYIHLIESRFPNLSDTSMQQIYSDATEIDLGRRLLPLPITERLLTATEVGSILGISANKVGRIANELNMKSEEYGEYRLSKSRFSTRQVEQFYYNPQAVAFLQEYV